MKIIAGDTIQDSRKEYLIQYRNGLWTQIRAKEDTVWRFISFFAASLVLVVGFIMPGNDLDAINKQLSMLTFILATTIVSFWGVLVTLDANYWMQRNLALIGNIERELLNKDDFGVLLPPSYIQPRHYKYSRSYFIQLIFFFLVISISLISFLTFAVNNLGNTSLYVFIVSQYVPLIYSLLLIYTIWRNKEWINDFGRLREHAPGKKVDDITSTLPILNVIETYWNSGFELFLYSFTLLGSIICFASSLLLDPNWTSPPQMGLHLFIGTLIICCFTCVLCLILRNKAVKYIKRVSEKKDISNQDIANDCEFKFCKSVISLIFAFEVVINLLCVIMSVYNILNIVILHIPPTF